MKIYTKLLARIQNELFDIGAELATLTPPPGGMGVIGDGEIAALEAAIDKFETDLPPLKNFILPGGTRAAALLHVARTVCRRAERRVITLAAEKDAVVSPRIVIYLNRASDLFFVLARSVNRASGKADIEWQKRT
jgi:cob(I)alamin adenosyltransferase